MKIRCPDDLIFITDQFSNMWDTTVEIYLQKHSCWLSFMSHMSLSIIASSEKDSRLWHFLICYQLHAAKHKFFLKSQRFNDRSNKVINCIVHSKYENLDFHRNLLATDMHANIGKEREGKTGRGRESEKEALWMEMRRVRDWVTLIVSNLGCVRRIKFMWLFFSFYATKKRWGIFTYEVNRKMMTVPFAKLQNFIEKVEDWRKALKTFIDFVSFFFLMYCTLEDRK